MHQNVSNGMKTLKKYATYFKPITSYDAIFNLFDYLLFSNILSVQGFVYSLVSHLSQQSVSVVIHS